jgi:hypothetical protein
MSKARSAPARLQARPDRFHLYHFTFFITLPILCGARARFFIRNLCWSFAAVVQTGPPQSQGRVRPDE